MFVSQPEARRASCVGSVLCALLAVETMGTAPCFWLLAHNLGGRRGGEGAEEGRTQRFNALGAIEVGYDC